MGIEMKDTIYVETTIPSFYHEVRTEPEMVARRTWTRGWWELARARAELVTSAAVLRELERGDYAARADCLALLGPLTLLAIDPDVLDIAATYVARHVMPADPGGDALHLALASYHRCDYLVTWNEREQVWPHPPGQHPARPPCADPGDPARADGGGRNVNPDPGLERTREARRLISRELGNDLRRLCEYYMEYQKQYADRLRWAPGSRHEPEEPAESVTVADAAKHHG